ncbi:MAG: hypothetical protein ACLGIO_00940 [Acidimicrobiia bacterium]
MPQAPIDLAELRRAAAPVVAWYEGFLAGQPMPLADLDRALVDLRALPPVGGRLGRALAMVGRAGRDATTEETIAALELLRHTAGLRHVPAPPEPHTAPVPSPTAKAPKRRRGPRQWSQPPLPGIEEQ